MIEAKQKLINRKIIEIDEDLCTGCGNCVVACAEGALQIIDGKAKVINEIFCDGLGACIGECPEGALKIIEREALEFDEEAVENHLEFLKGKEESVDDQIKLSNVEFDVPCGCPSAKSIVFNNVREETNISGRVTSTLRHWPVQMHLISPIAPYYQGADVIISADCVAYSYGNFHGAFLKNKSIAIVCPKLDQGRESYIQKIKSLIDDAKINTLTVTTMEVPCCSGLLALAFGLYTYVNPVPTVTGGPNLVKLLTVDCKDVTGGILHVETDPKEAVDAIMQHIESNRKKLGI